MNQDDISSEQRIARRLALMDSFDIFMREVIYQRAHLENYETPGISIWRVDQEEGSNDSPLFIEV